MRILFVAADPLTAVRVRPRNFVRFLSKAGHQVTVVTPAPSLVRDARGFGLPDGAEAVHMPMRVGPGRRLLNLAHALLTAWPLQAYYAWHPRLASFLLQLVHQAAQEGRPFHLAHVEHLRASLYALRLRNELPVVWDSVDSITLLLEQARKVSLSRKGRWIAALDLGRTRQREGWLATRFAAVTVTSERDRQALCDQVASLVASRHGRRAALPQQVELPPPEIAVVRNGVDLEAFAPDGPREEDVIVFTGKLSYHANVTAARYLVENIMPLVWRERPGVRLILAGSEPAAEVRALARRQERITITGFVSDLAAVLRRATVAVAPLVYGVGIQNKVLEAMATATPVVATPTAVEALSVRWGDEVLVARDPRAFAQAVLCLLADPTRAREVGQAGRHYVEAHHTWSNSVVQLVGVYERALERERVAGAGGGE